MLITQPSDSIRRSGARQAKGAGSVWPGRGQLRIGRLRKWIGAGYHSHVSIVNSRRSVVPLGLHVVTPATMQIR